MRVMDRTTGRRGTVIPQPVKMSRKKRGTVQAEQMLWTVILWDGASEEESHPTQDVMELDSSGGSIEFI